MNRRKAIKIAAGVLAAGGAGVVTLTTAFKSNKVVKDDPKKISFINQETSWTYSQLGINEAANLAYENYNIGSCMYGVFSSIISLLSKNIGEPYTSFPIHMMKYGHGGIGGSGTICGTLNGATAIFGLLIDDKGIRDALTAELFSWYENTPFPNFIPDEPVLDFRPPSSISKSVLCHASTTKWGKEAGYRIDSKERKERCRCLTADVAAKTVEILNSYFNNSFTSTVNNNETAKECIACHGSHGKLGNTSGKMNCTSCHDESLGHKLFGDAHYKFMKKK